MKIFVIACILYFAFIVWIKQIFSRKNVEKDPIPIIAPSSNSEFEKDENSAENSEKFQHNGYIGIVYEDYITFNILGTEVHLISDETACGRNTIAEIKDKYYYMGNEDPDIAAALVAWQKLTGNALSFEQIDQILVDNHIVSNKTLGD